MGELEREALRIVETCLGLDDRSEQARMIVAATDGRPDLRARLEGLKGHNGRRFRLSRPSGLMRRLRRRRRCLIGSALSASPG